MPRRATHTILFAGHRLDPEGRPAPRFPPAMEPVARAAIRRSLARLLRDYGAAQGVAGGASGGDILFHEVCAELDVPTRLYLPMPPATFVAESVAPAGDDWVRRFEAITGRVPLVLMSAREGDATPVANGDTWERNNQWLVDEALAGGADNLTVLVLWNGVEGDGPGGTDHLVALATARGADVRILDTRALFQL